MRGWLRAGISLGFVICGPVYGGTIGFKVGMWEGHNGAIENVSSAASIVSLALTLPSGTYFDTTSAAPGEGLWEGWAIASHDPGLVSAVLPDNSLTNGSRDASLAFSSFGPGDTFAWRVDLDNIGNSDGTEIGTNISVTFSTGDTLTDTVVWGGVRIPNLYGTYPTITSARASVSVPESPPSFTAGTTIYDNGSPSPIASNYYSDLEDTIKAADDFILPSDSNVITGLQWWGLYASGVFDDQFRVRIYADDGGRPNQFDPFIDVFLGEVLREYSGIDERGNVIYRYLADLPSPITLPADTTYWLSLVNRAEINSSGGWRWQRSSTSGMHARQIQWNPWATSENGTLAFQLTGLRSIPAPEPATVTLFGLGLACLGAMQWKKLAA